MATSKKTDTGKKSATVNIPAPAAETPEPSVKLPPLYRPMDWLTALLTTALVFLGYYLTLAPDLSLEDSGELAVGSMYAAVPHPPGYPVWSIYTWVFTKILPFSNMAWRVAVASAFAGAVASGLIGLMVSRGSSMMIESIAELKEIPRRLENVCCVAAGVVAGMLLGFNGFVWSQAVIVEVYSLSNLSLAAVLCFLLHYMYNPRQKRYLYMAFFLFGISFTNHQSLLLAAIGIETTVLVANRQLGRYLFAGNALFYALGLAVMAFFGGLSSFGGNPPLFLIFNSVGICSLYVFLWYSVRMETLTKWLILTVHLLINLLVFFMWTTMLRKLNAQPGDPRLLESAVQGYVVFLLLFNPTLIACSYAFSLLTGHGEKAFHTSREWWAIATVIVCGFLWAFGAAFNLWMPITSMTNPPMNWGYPRTFDGFLHAMSRGQYERTNPCDFVSDPFRFLGQLWMYFIATLKEFNPVYFSFLAVPLIYFRKMQKRERGWLIGLSAVWACLGVVLLIMLNPNTDRQTKDLIKVFFTSSYVLLAMLMGYGITLSLAALYMHYERYRKLAIVCGVAALALAALNACITFEPTNRILNLVSERLLRTRLGEPSYYFLNHFLVLFGLLLAGLTTLFLTFARKRAPLAGLLMVVALMPIYPITDNWSDNEQRHHYFGFWFGHDMFSPGVDTKVAPAPKDKDGKPVYPEMERDTVLFGGTDPGRFCPTYMIFCESFIPPEDRLDPSFDRRDVYIITQNALADGTYLNYIRGHYNRSEQYRYDSPFFAGAVERLQDMTLSKEARDRKTRREFYQYGSLGKTFGILHYLARPLDGFFTNLGDRVEGERRAGSSRFKAGDFKDLPALVARIKPGAQQDPLGKFIYERLARETQNLLSSGNEKALRTALARDLNVIIEAETIQIQKLKELEREKKSLVADSASRNKTKIEQLDEEAKKLLSRETVYTSNKFAGIKLPPNLILFLNENPQSWTRVRMNRQLLEAAYPDMIVTSPGGLYPDREIRTPSDVDSQECFKEYIDNVQKRLEHDRLHPNEPPQIRPGEDVKLTPDGRVQVAGQVAVMTINGLLTRRIFDANTNHAFYIEESFPLDWMYPYLTPFGIIMKINRQPLPTLTEEVLQKDHEFWSQYSQRLIGNWITYDTPVQEIASFAERVYVRHDYTGFKGDPRFVRDDQAQKSFSKLRSSIAGVYAWRIGPQCPPEFRPKTNEEYQRVLREAEFSFKQAFAFCPYSPEAVFRYINVLFSLNRYEDALIIAKTCLKLDPNNAQVEGLVKQLEVQLPDFKQRQAAILSMQSNVTSLQEKLRLDPNNFSNAFALASSYLSFGQTNLAEGVLDGILANPTSSADAILGAADYFAKLASYAKLERALARLVVIQPENPEAWFDLAALYVNTGRTTEGLAALRKCVGFSNARLAADPRARNLLEAARTDQRFTLVRQSPEFQRIMAGQ